MRSILCPSVFEQANSPYDPSIKTGMRIIYNEAEDSTNALDSFVQFMNEKGNEYTPADFTICTYSAEVEYFKDTMEMTETEWKYFDFDGFLLEEWSNYGCKKLKDVYILFKQDDGCYTLLEQVSERSDIWKGRVETFFTTHPSKNNLFYIIRPSSAIINKPSSD